MNLVYKGKSGELSIGDVKGCYTIIGPSINQSKGNTKVLVRCKCGIEKNYDAFKLTNNFNGKGCMNCNNRTEDFGFECVPSGYMVMLKKAAIKRKLVFEITAEDVYNLFLNQNKKCVFTNLDIRFKATTNDYKATASLDRIDSTKGYIKDNIQLVHKDINVMKSNFSDKYFVNMCKLVSFTIHE